MMINDDDDDDMVLYEIDSVSYLLRLFYESTAKLRGEHKTQRAETKIILRNILRPHETRERMEGRKIPRERGGRSVVF